MTRQLLREMSVMGERVCERERFSMQITWRKRNTFSSVFSNVGIILMTFELKQSCTS